MGAIFSVTLLRGIIDHRAHAVVGRLPHLWVVAVENDLDDEVHLPQPDDEGREQVETVLPASALGDFPEIRSVGATHWRDRAECDVGAVRVPVDPGKFLEVRNASRDATPGPEIVVFGQGSRVDPAGAGDLHELSVNNLEFVLPYLLWTVGHAVIQPGAIAMAQGFRDLVNNLVRHGLLTLVIGAARLS